jgi:hypothetical protein
MNWNELGFFFFFFFFLFFFSFQFVQLIRYFCIKYKFQSVNERRYKFSSDKLLLLLLLCFSSSFFSVSSSASLQILSAGSEHNEDWSRVLFKLSDPLHFFANNGQLG